MAWAVGRLVRLRPGPERRTFTFIAGIQNYAYVAIPIVLQLYPGALGVLFLFTLGVELVIWTVGLVIVSGAPLGELWRRVLNPTVGAILLGVGLGLADLARGDAAGAAHRHPHAGEQRRPAGPPPHRRHRGRRAAPGCGREGVGDGLGDDESPLARGGHRPRWSAWACCRSCSFWRRGGCRSPPSSGR